MADRPNLEPEHQKLVNFFASLGFILGGILAHDYLSRTEVESGKELFIYLFGIGGGGIVGAILAHALYGTMLFLVGLVAVVIILNRIGLMVRILEALGVA